MIDLAGMTPEEVAEFGTKPWRQYVQQRLGAKHRGISWELSFPQWWSIWRDSGKYRSRGVQRGGHVMARKWDIGPYAIDNVEIQTVRDNAQTAGFRRRHRRVRMQAEPIRPPGFWRGIDDDLIEEEEQACNF